MSASSDKSFDGQCQGRQAQATHTPASEHGLKQTKDLSVTDLADLCLCKAGAGAVTVKREEGWGRGTG